MRVIPVPASMKNNESSAFKFIIFRNVYRNRVLAPYRWGQVARTSLSPVSSSFFINSNAPQWREFELRGKDREKMKYSPILNFFYRKASATLIFLFS